MIALLCSALLGQAEPAAETPPLAAQLQFFETRVRPVLAEQCLKCHGPDKQWAGLRVDSRAALLRGGESGASIVPGRPNDSRLILAIRREDPDLQMPPETELPADQIRDLERWVAWGAPFPSQPEPSERLRDPHHWAFQPPVAPALPGVQDNSWSQSPLDRFVLANLEQASLTPAPPADPRTLIRRLAFDLTGLPPAPADIDEFLADDRADAYARLVDRLLASPAYGERWGRHWLDVARYADSNGLDENIAHGNAWRYRDYVVAAFNRDEPFDRFVVAQLAGDLLPATNETQRHEQLIATGFLAIGPKVLAEVNQAKMQMDIVDEQIDTLGRVFLGMTLGCARCHDHKFDPIDTGDYYGLAGIFKSTRTMETYTKVARWHEHPLPSATAAAMRQAYAMELAARKRAIDERVAAADKLVRVSLPVDRPSQESLEGQYPESTQATLKKLREELQTLEKNPPEYPAAMGVTEDPVTDVPIHIRGNPLNLGDLVPRHVPRVLAGAAVPRFSASASGRRELAEWLIDPQHPLTARVIVNRIWRWHFGEGLVRTTENFGLLGERPSHPELLDWLARRFVSDAWSFKAQQRMILSSSTYQQSSSPAAGTIDRDPENRLFGRARLRRLEAEEIRDTLLAVSDQLDRAVGGSSLQVKNRGYLFDHTSIDLTDYTSRRRSLFLPVIRNHVFDLFQLMDFPDPAVPNGNRPQTTVPLQALMMLNSDFVMQSADGLATRLLTACGDDDQRLAQLYAVAYGREPTGEERRAQQQFLAAATELMAATQPDAAEPRQRAWSLLCHTLIAANEFIYVR